MLPVGDRASMPMVLGSCPAFVHEFLSKIPKYEGSVREYIGSWLNVYDEGLHREF